MTAAAAPAPALAPATDRRLLWSIGLLFVMQGLTGQFVIQAVPLFLRQAGHGPAVLGLIYVAALPYVLRFLWAPLVDRYGHVGFGHRRSWIVGMQVVVLGLIGAFAALDPAASPRAVIVVAALVMVALGTQLTAAGALMIELFAPARYPRAASIQAASAGLAGLLLGAGVLFLLGDLGWRPTVLGIAALSFVAFALVLLEPFDRGRVRNAAPAPLFGQFAMFRDRELRAVLWLAIAAGVGGALPYGMKTILQVDAGLSMAEIGVIGIVGGNAVGLLAALAMRPAVERFGGYRCLGAVAAVSAVLCLGVALLLAAAPPGRWLAIGFVLGGNALAFAAFTAERSLAMPLCAPEQTATRFATFVSLDGASVLACAAIGNGIAQFAGMTTVFLVAAAGSVAGATYASLLARRVAGLAAR